MPSPTPGHAAPASAERYPPQIPFIVANEGCERFSFYGMRSILTVYMAQHLFFPEHGAKAWYHLFVMANYLTPLVGGWIADRFFGRYRVIFWLSTGYVLGHAVVAAVETRVGLLLGCALIAAGAGGIKPCVSAYVGDQFHPGQKKLLERVYALFYWMINLGSVTSTLLIPELLARYGPSVAFAVPGVLMAVALVVFRAGRSRYVDVPPTGPNPHSFLRVVREAVRRRGSSPPGAHWLDAALASHPGGAVEGAKAVLRVAAVFAAVTGFWALFDQHGSSWVLQAQQMDLRLGGWEMRASQLSALNPAMVLAIIPVFHGGLYPRLERRGFRVTALGKMTAGMFVTTLSFAAMAVLQALIDGGGRPHALWQIVPYLFLTAGEVLVSVTGLEFAYTQAPRSMKSTIMSFWFLTIAAGNLVAAWVSEANRFQGAAFFAFFAVLVLVAAVIFALVARRYRPVAAGAAVQAA
jgi:POT family proton-dependent oligopeptide transporter